MKRYLHDTVIFRIPSASELEAADDGTRIICLMTGTRENGEPGWIFLAVRPSLYEIFHRKCQKSEELLPEAYGEVIANGAGLPPPEEIVRKMQADYGFDPHFNTRLVEEAKKQQKAFFIQQDALRIQNIVAALQKKNPLPPHKDPKVF